MRNTNQDPVDLDKLTQREKIKKLPKADLHVHLEGSIRPKTLLSLARKNKIDLPFLNKESADEDSIIKYNQFAHFSEFMKRVDGYASVLCNPEDFTQVTKELGIDAANENVRYMEVTFSPGIYTGLYQQEKKLSFSELMDAIATGAEEAKKECGIEMRFILDHDRDFSDYPIPTSAFESISYYETIAGWCKKGMNKGVVALGLAGHEKPGNMVSVFKDVIKPKIAEGIPFIPHAGENLEYEGTEDAVKDAIEMLLLPSKKTFPKRIGHGIGSINKNSLIEDLIKEKIMLEICLTSNIKTKCVTDIKKHPLRRLWDKSVLLTLNTDDPGIYNTTLTKEYQLAFDYLGFTINDLARMSLTAIQNSFLSEDKKKRMEKEFIYEFKALQVVPTNRTSATARHDESTSPSRAAAPHIETPESKEPVYL